MTYTGVIYLIQHENNKGFFWSTEVGWTTLTRLIPSGGATIFTPAEREEFNLPSGGKWIALHSHESLIKILEEGV